MLSGCLFVLGFGVLHPLLARADASPGTAGGANEPPPVSCDIKGTPVMAKGVILWSDARGGTPAATFAGQPIGLTATSFPSGSTGARVPVRTSGGIRATGFVDGKDLPLYTAANLAVTPGHVWIAEGQRVTLISAGPGLLVEASLGAPVSQSIRATAPCGSLSLDKKPRPAWDVPGNGRGYLPRHDSLDLVDQPGGGFVHSLRIGQPSGMLFWSTQARDGFVHLEYHEDLVVDGWVPASELAPLKPGETMDRLAPPSNVVGSARLVMAGQPTVARAAREVPLRLSPKEAAAAVGFIEAGNEVYVTDTVQGWSSVLPRALDLLPPDGHSFWVPSTEVSSKKP